MRVLIVDDSAFMRKMIRQIIESRKEFEVVGIARDGVEAVEQAKSLKPDLITLDIEMPNKNGLDALREIRLTCRQHPPAVLMCSSLTEQGSAETFKAMRIGAADVIAKDPQKVGAGDETFRRELIDKLLAIGGHRTRLRSLERTGPVATPPNPTPAHTTTDPKDLDLGGAFDVIVVGSSTGGPPVLEEIFMSLPAALPVPIIVAQHMPALFTASLSTRLNQNCACEVVMMTHGMDVRNAIMIAQGGKHLRLTRIRTGVVIGRAIDDVPGAIYRPSVDVLFQSAADLYGGRVLAIQLTGMGEDGAKGAGAIKRAGGSVICQNEQSCVVYGMPKSVVDAGHADALLDVKQIGSVLRDTIARITQSGGKNARNARRSA